MTRLFEKADRLLAMSRGNIITGLTFSRHSSGVSGSFLVPVGFLKMTRLFETPAKMQKIRHFETT
jgi:hypothetical protein